MAVNSYDGSKAVIKLLPWEHCERRIRPIKPVDEHAWDLGWWLGLEDLPSNMHAGTQELDWYTVGNWLMAAGGLRQVGFNLHAFDASALYCPPAYTATEQADLTAFVADLARFSFIWHSFEAAIHKTQPRSQIKKHGGEVALGVLKVKEFQAQGGRLEHADCTSNNLLRVLNQLKRHSGEKAHRKAHVELTKAGTDPELAEALSAARHLRNGFAHGGLFFPDPQVTQTLALHRSVIVLSTRIVLLSLQAILLGAFENQVVMVQRYDDDDELRDIDACQLLADLHIGRPSLD